jgi:DNA-binding CsgD family transcriptional regulator
VNPMEDAVARAVGQTSKNLVFVALPSPADDVEEQLSRAPLVLLNTDIEPDGRLISFLRQAGFIIAGTSFSTSQSDPSIENAVVVDVVRQPSEQAGLAAHQAPSVSPRPSDAAHDYRPDSTKKTLAFSDLTSRERLVLSDLIDGYHASAIAERACVSVATVRTQIRSILQKLGVNSQLAAVALARQAGWTLTQSDSNPRAS